jgi:hypothetical protein
MCPWDFNGILMGFPWLMMVNNNIWWVVQYLGQWEG